VRDDRARFLALHRAHTQSAQQANLTAVAPEGTSAVTSNLGPA
jgi:hypothetical protein